MTIGILIMSLYKDYLESTFRLASKLNRTKVSTIRQATAESYGFRTIKSYEKHLKDLDRKSYLINDNDWLLYLTNTIGESCFDHNEKSSEGIFGSDIKRLFKSLSLSYSRVDYNEIKEAFYPLSVEEGALISEDNSIDLDDYCMRAASTAIINGEKYIELEWCEYTDEENTPEVLVRKNLKIKDVLIDAAEKINGKVMWSHVDRLEENDEVMASLFVPMALCIKHTKTPSELVIYLTDVFNS